MEAVSKMRKDTPARLPNSKILLRNRGITFSVDECDDDEDKFTLEEHNGDDDKQVPEVFETVIVQKRKTSFLVPREDREQRRNSVTFDDSVQVKDNSADNTDTDNDTDNDEGVYNHLELKDDSDEDSDERLEQLSQATSSLAMKVRKDSLKGMRRPPKFRWCSTPPSTPVGSHAEDSHLTLRVLEKTKEKVLEKV